MPQTSREAGLLQKGKNQHSEVSQIAGLSKGKREKRRQACCQQGFGNQCCSVCVRLPLHFPFFVPPVSCVFLFWNFFLLFLSRCQIPLHIENKNKISTYKLCLSQPVIFACSSLCMHVWHTHTLTQVILVHTTAVNSEKMDGE